MPTIGEAAHFSGDDETIDSKARRLWETLVGKCKGLNIPVRRNGNLDGYLYNGNLNLVVGELWPNLLIKDGRETPVAKSFVSTLRNHLKANKNVNFDVVRGQLFISSTYHEPKVKSGRVTPVSIIAEKDEITLLDKSKRIWTRARNYCSKNGRPTQIIDGVTFWECDKPLNYFVTAEFPGLHDFERQKRPLYDFLRSTTNAVNIGSKTDDNMKDGDHHWLIRDDWCEAGTKVVIRNPKNPDNIDRRAARLTPEEAGETRTPEPVVIKQPAKAPEAAPMPTPAPATPTAKPTSLNCPDCKFVAQNAYGLAAHSKVHKMPAALKLITDAIEQGQKDAAKVENLTSKVETLTEDLARTKAELEVARTQGDASTLMELLSEVLIKANSGTISPMRAVADVDDLLRTMKGQQ